MLERYFKINLSLFLIITFILSSSCGKVTQQLNAPQPDKSFSLTVEIPILTSRNVQLQQQANYQFPTSNYITTLDKDVYAVIYGIRKDGKRDELSWGHGVLSKKEPLESDKFVDKNVFSLNNSQN